MWWGRVIRQRERVEYECGGRASHFRDEGGDVLEGREEEFRERLGELYKRVTEGEKREGVGRIWFPGEKEAVMQRQREKEGIPFTRGEVQSMNEVAAKVGVPDLETSETPFV